MELVNTFTLGENTAGLVHVHKGVGRAGHALVRQAHVHHDRLVHVGTATDRLRLNFYDLRCDRFKQDIRLLLNANRDLDRVTDQGLRLFA